MNTNNNSKWEIIYKELKRKIEEGVYKKNDILKLKTITEKYEVSEITARRVFNELKREGIIHSIPKKGTVILTEGKLEDIYIIVKDENLIYRPPLNTQLFTRIIDGFKFSYLSKLYRKNIFSIDFLLSNKKKFIGKNIVIFVESLLKIQEDKVEIDIDIVERIKEFSPIIINSFGKIGNFTVIGTDFYKGFYSAIEYLFKKGHKTIGFISGDINNPWFYPRFCGYIDGLKNCGLKIIPEIIKITRNLQHEDERAIEEIMKFKKRPTAILCVNDLRAINILNWCKENNFRIPDDISIMGFDNIDETKFTTPKLTTMDSKLYLQGDVVLKMLMQRKEKEKIKDVFIEPEIIERESVKEVEP